MIYISIFKWIFIEIKITSYHCSFFFKEYIEYNSKLFSFICKVNVLVWIQAIVIFDIYRSKILYVLNFFQ